jgi:hypothetical protein
MVLVAYRHGRSHPNFIAVGAREERLALLAEGETAFASCFGRFCEDSSRFPAERLARAKPPSRSSALVPTRRAIRMHRTVLRQCNYLVALRYAGAAGSSDVHRVVGQSKAAVDIRQAGIQHEWTANLHS